MGASNPPSRRWPPCNTWLTLAIAGGDPDATLCSYGRGRGALCGRGQLVGGRRGEAERAW